MKRNAARTRRKPATSGGVTRPSRGGIQKRSTSRSGGRRSGESSSRKASRPTHFSLLKDVEHALKYEHMEGASLQNIKRHLEKRYGGRPFDANTNKMLRSAVKRLHKRGRIKKHPTSSVYKIKPPIVPAHHIFGTGGSKGRSSRSQSRPPPSRKAQSSAKRSRSSRSSRPSTRRRR